MELNITPAQLRTQMAILDMAGGFLTRAEVDAIRIIEETE